MSIAARRKIAFVDRDGTILAEPADEQIDALEKVVFVNGAIPGLIALRDAGFELVLVSNQDGLGTDAFPQACFEPPQRLMLQVLDSCGIGFAEVLIDSSLPADRAPTRKPGLGLVLHYLRDRSVDLAASAVIGDRATDLAFAEALGVRGYRLDGAVGWPAIVADLTRGARASKVTRRTRETAIEVSIDLDRMAPPDVSTGQRFFDHMLDQLGLHGGFALQCQAKGDLDIDDHHTVEDCALAMGQALREALGDKTGISRYGSAAQAEPADETDDHAQPSIFTLPMDDAIAQAAIDLSGRPYFVFDGAFSRELVGGMATELVPHFFRSLCDAGGINLHLSVRGDNAHHAVEACFKVVGRALRQALAKTGNALPSTKGVL